MTEMITLIQCTKSKRDEPAEAKYLYDESAYYRKMRAYAEATGRDWYILSAKHGLVTPTETLKPYDDVGLSEGQARAIAERIAQETNCVEIIAGKKYTNPLTPELERHGVDVIELCRGMGIGERMQKLQTLTQMHLNGQFG